MGVENFDIPELFLWSILTAAHALAQAENTLSQNPSVCYFRVAPCEAVILDQSPHVLTIPP